MALALADSLAESKTLDCRDLMDRFVKWWQDGDYSCTGHCFDIGNTTQEALARYRCFRHQVLLRGCGQWYRCGRDRVARPTEQENLDPRPQRNRRRQEDVSKGEPSRRQTSLHSRSSDLTSELQSSVRSDEVVIATEQLQVLIEPLRRASVGKRSSRKVCRALPDGQIQTAR